MISCKHGLDKPTCADCSPPRRAPRARFGPPRTFTARYDDHCRQCNDDIAEGDTVGYVDDQIACEDCVREDAR